MQKWGDLFRSEIKKIATNDDPAHDVLHFERVVQTSKCINQLLHKSWFMHLEVCITENKPCLRAELSKILTVLSLFVLVFMAPFIEQARASNSNKFIHLDTPPETLDKGPGFVEPNEYEPYEVRRYLQNSSGALISVGTFRALYDAGSGEFSEVYLLDYNKSVCDFNKEHLLFIEGSKTRQDYLARLFDDANAVSVIESYEKGEIAPEVIKAKLIAAIDKIEKTSKQKFLKSNAGYLHIMVRFILDLKLYRQSFLGNDSDFLKIKRLIAENRIYVIPGSLTGKRVVSWLAQSLKQRDQEVSILDISNVEDYIKGQEKQYMSNIVKIPFKKSGLVIKTIDGAIPPNIYGAGWGYQTIPAQKYKSEKPTCAKVFGG